MTGFVPYSKMSKKQKKEKDRQNRTLWNMPCITKVKPSGKIYSRKDKSMTGNPYSLY